jgi:hypothetical protein
MNTIQTRTHGRSLRLALGGLAAAGSLAALTLAAVPALASAHPAGSSGITGPELIAGTIHGKKALANVSKIPLQWQGVVTTHSVIVLGGGGSPKKGQEKSLPSPAGKLVVQVSAKPQQMQSMNAKTCKFTFSEYIPVTVVGAKSTGKFAGASGPGAAKIYFAAVAPRFKSGPHKGQCNPNGKPSTKSATATFLASVVLTTK